MTTSDCEVLVVGAGPTGLMAADLLKRSGVDVRIVDDRAEASRESRAFAVMARSMELFGRLDLADRLLDRGVIEPGIDFFVGGRPVGGLDYDRAESPDTPYQFITLHPQNRTEEVLLDDLARLGVQVERRTAVTALDQDAGGVTARATGPDGAATSIRAAYAIGADGAHSTVRRALGLSFEGAKYAQTFMLADCRVAWPLDHARFRVFMHGSTIALFLPLDGAERSRVMVTDPSNAADRGGPEAAELALAELEPVYREATGQDVRLSEAAWATRYRVHHRGVPHYRVGRAFLAGDAAHIHSPAGGQGMNTGLQDAANLAWKLAAVLKRGAPADILDSYETERLPVGRQVVETSDRMFAAAAGQSGWQAAARDWLAHPVSAAIAHSGTVQRRAFRKLSQLEIAYPLGPFVEDAAPGLGRDGPQVGRRAPDAAIDRTRHVFDLLDGTDFTLLALSRKPLERGEARQAAEAVEALRGPGLSAFFVTRMAVGRDGRCIVATQADVFDAYGVTRRDGQATFLVRPDGYVAWRADGLAVEAARQALARFGFGGLRHG